MNEKRPAAARKRRETRLIVLHSIPQPDFLATRRQLTPPLTPHYYIDAGGETHALAAEDQIAAHSGSATWRKHRRNIDRISIGVGLEHTPGTPLSSEQVLALHELIGGLLERHGLERDALRIWESTEAHGGPGRGLLQDADALVPPAIRLLSRRLLATQLAGIHSAPAARSAPEAQAKGGIEDPGGGPQALALPKQVSSRDLWLFLQRESYARRGGRLAPDWTFHRLATARGLGAPLAASLPASQAVAFGGKSYGMQPFARDVLFNEIAPRQRWDEVQSLRELLGGALPAGGLGRALLAKTYALGGFPLVEGYTSHQFAVANNLGPALGKNYPLAVDGVRYGVQVFAGDTLYSREDEGWARIYRLSETPPGNLRRSLWRETYLACGATYEPGDPFQSFAEQQPARGWLGAPLTGAYAAAFGGQSYRVQVFAYDTLYAAAGQAPQRLSALPAVDLATVDDRGGAPDDAVSANPPLFAVLPVPMSSNPVISQFFGYTAYASQDRLKPAADRFYTNTQGRHSGIDFWVADGTPVLAVAHGLVVGAGAEGDKANYPFGGCPPYGIIVRYGSVYAIYGHCKQVSARIGQRVAPGDQLGLSGTYGGAHLHFELRPVVAQLGNADPAQRASQRDNSGRAVNPIGFFSPALRDGFFKQQYRRLGGISQFCCDDLDSQGEVRFGGPVDSRPCANR